MRIGKGYARICAAVMTGISAWMPIYGVMSVAAPARAEAYLMSSNQERNVGIRAANTFEEEHACSYNPILDNIQKRLMKYNPGEIWFQENRGSSTRWVERIRYAKTGKVNAVCFPGGRIYVYDGMMNDLSIVDADGQNYSARNPWQEKNIYQMASLAQVIGHEHGHWANEDFLQADSSQRWLAAAGALIPGVNIWATLASMSGTKLVQMFTARQMSFDDERDADAAGIHYTENVPEYSIGGAAMYQYRHINFYGSEGSPSWENWIQPHSNSEKRLERALHYMEETSNGFFRWEGLDLYQEGQKWPDMPFNSRDDVHYMDRKFYVIGQLATTIKFRTCSLSNLKYYREDEVFPGGSRNRTVLVMDGAGALPGGKKLNKLIDIYAVPKDQLMAWAKKFERGIDPDSELGKGLFRNEIVSFLNVWDTVSDYDDNKFHYMVNRNGYEGE